MKKSFTLTYKVGDNIYVNMTNRCPCSCTFCLRFNADGAYGSDPLWLEREPSVEEVCASLDTWDMSKYKEIVFCGYGEPTVRLDDLLLVAKYVKEKYNMPTRINTTGLSDLIFKKDTAPMYEGLIDTVSISLNATNKEDYLKLTRSSFGIESYDAMLKFAKNVKKYVPNVVMTVVDQVTSKEEQKKAQEICDFIGVKLRIRPFES